MNARKKIATVVLALTLSFATAVAIAPPAAAAITYECRKYHWLFGWHKITTTSYTKVIELQRNGYTCYCIG